MSSIAGDSAWAGSEKVKKSYIVLFVILGFSIFGSHLYDGYLSDDFLYVTWAKQSLSALVARLSLYSYPQVIRPLPALAWMLSRLDGGSVLMHSLSIVLHSLNSALVFFIARRRGAPQLTAFLLGVLFLVFPLSGEAVLWLSSGFDLWAAFFTLLTLAIVQLSEVGKASAASLLFYGIALLCKESAFALPLALLILFPTFRRRIVPFLAVMAIYIAARLYLFGGMGGYKDKLGHMVLAQASPVAFVRALLMQVPARILAPIPVESRLTTWLMVGISLLVIGAVGWAGFRSWRSIFVSLSVFVVAILPAAHLLRVEWDLQGARLLYLPLALAFVALAGYARPAWVAPRFLGLLLVGYWLIATVANGRSWSGAGEKVRQTLQAMKVFQLRVPSESTILVDTLDTYKGAYVFRNGLPEAAELAGLRSDLTWRRGTVALLGPEARQDLGTRLFEIGIDDVGRATDWTLCEQSPQAIRRPNRALRLNSSPGTSLEQPLQQWLSSPVAALPSDCQLVMLSASCHGFEAVTGTLFWKTKREGQFTTMEARELKLSDGHVSVRLSGLASQDELWLRIDLDQPMPSSCWSPAFLTICQPSCARYPFIVSPSHG